MDDVQKLSGNLAPVSVIIPCYCCGTTISRAVKSVYAQSLRPVEIILINDKSPDNTLDELYSLQSSFPNGWIRIIELSDNVGPGLARNAGWDVAVGEYIAFLDSDDSWHSKKIEIQYTWMKDHQSHVLTGHKCPFVTNSDELSGLRGEADVKDVTLNALLMSNRFITPTVMLKRNIKNRFPCTKYAEDYWLWLDIVSAGLKSAYINLSLAAIYKHHYGQSGLSSDLWHIEKGELGCFKYLYESKRIGLGKLLIISTFSFLKYIRRVVKVFIR